MPSRCDGKHGAAGTGRFLENMARALGMDVGKFAGHALAAQGSPMQLSSMCTVFAEPEVVSLIGRGEDSRRVALGIHAGPPAQRTDVEPLPVGKPWVDVWIDSV